MAKTTYKPKWIWIARGVHLEDYYLRARRPMRLTAKPVAARLRVTACSEYALYVNGQYVGSGPAPAAAESPLLDVYTEADLPLVRGPNCIAVLAHNYHVGLPRLPRLPAGLWLQLEVTYPDGSTEMIATDRQWRVAPAEDFNLRAPRLYWTAGFAEIRDTRYEPPRWTTFKFPDKKWLPADEIKYERPQGAPPQRLRERLTARLTETYLAPQAVAASGRLAWHVGVTAVPFEFAVPNPAHGEFYAGTFVYCPTKRKARLVFDCDESAAVYVNNRQVLRQGYNESFVQWLGEEEHDDYTGIHRGQGIRAESHPVELDAEWNSLGVVIYDPGRAWGFAVRFEDVRSGEALPLVFSPDQKPTDMADWHVVHEQLCPCGDGALPDTPAPNERTFPDPAYQLAWEKQTVLRKTHRGAAALLASGDGSEPLVLKDGEFLTYDFGREVVGYIEVDIEGPAGVMADFVWSEALGPEGDIDPVRRGMRQADRLILAGGRQTVRLFNRRTLRYLQVVARLGEGDDGTLSVHRLGLYETGRLTGLPQAITSEDARLGGALAIIDRTVRCCLQQTLEGSPAREAEQSLPAAYLLGQAERYLFGRTELGEVALRAFAADQNEEGFFRSVVPSGTLHTVPDWNLLWILWLADHVAWTGDRALAKELYPVAERCLDWTATFQGMSGLLENRGDRQPWWLFVDLSPMDKHGEVTAWQALYARALRAAADVAEFLGDEDGAAHGRAEAETIADRTRDRLWDVRRERFSDVRLYDHVSRQSAAATNYYALYGGLATTDQAQRMLANLWKDGREAAGWGVHPNPYVKHFALEALLERGMADRAMTIIRSYWGGMAEAGLTTVPEAWPLPDGRAKADLDGQMEGPYGRMPPTVLCHGWGVHPASAIARWVLGVRPGGPGFDPLMLAPMPGELKHVSGRVWTPKGPVEVSIRKVGEHHEIQAAVPEGMPYRLVRDHLEVEDVVEIRGGQALPEP